MPGGRHAAFCCAEKAPRAGAENLVLNSMVFGHALRHKSNKERGRNGKKIRATT
nr:MAG TPA_asm: hypothetical protein [Bacteriophage sp.]